MTKAGLFLRAINVGGRKLLMADFKAALAESGMTDIRTLGAAGTAVVEAQTGGADLEARVEAVLARTSGMAVEVFARDSDAMAAIVAGNPFVREVADRPALVAVSFLKGEAGPAGIEAVREKIAGFGGPEEIKAGPAGCLYLSYPAGQGDSKLTPAAIERATGLRGTARNWNTVLKVAEMTKG